MFQGLVWQGDSKDIRDVTTGAVPVFSEIKMMAYVGISEFFFNSAAMSVYRLGPFQLNVPEVRPAEKPPLLVFCLLFPPVFELAGFGCC